jgi:ribose transport system permease protein
MATQSIKSDALEPDLNDLRGKGVRGLFSGALRLFPVYGLVFITVLLAILFSILLPDTFCTWMNARLILSNQSGTALLALAAMIPMVAGKIDLSIGYGVVLWEVLTISLQTTYHLPWLLVMVILLFFGGVFGLLNALLVEFARIDAFIATLGTGTVVYALALWHTNGQQVIGDIPDSFLQLANGSLFDIPLPALYVLVLSIFFWIVLDYLPLGRCLYAVGANPEAARLNGIPTRWYIALAFVTSGMVTAFAGVVLASKLRIGQIGVGLDYLLPALGHHRCRGHSRDRHFRSATARWRILRRTAVQRPDAADGHRSGRVRRPAAGCSSQKRGAGSTRSIASGSNSAHLNFAAK